MPMPDETSLPTPPENPAAPTPEKADAPAQPSPAPQRRNIIRRVGVIVGLIVLVFVGWSVFESFRTVSTDDAYVNSYVTCVAPRVTGQVAQVLVDHNNRVKKGDVLVQLDPEPYQVKLAIKQAALDKAQADYAVAEASVRSQSAQARSQRFKLEHAVDWNEHPG